MIRLCDDNDTATLHHIINDAATAYKGIIPDDRYHEPYMSMEELEQELKEDVVFWGYMDSNHQLTGVMGLQDKGKVCLIRHAYVRSTQRNTGIGSKLLIHLTNQTEKPILIGTWGSATWAIKFYEKNGFHIVSTEDKVNLLHEYWNVPDRQIETSVVLSNCEIDSLGR
ncbi:GNAT family N-acetyltransferase [Cohnella sp. WQ 127256]|uniref:GNAT family N-acetyltransferase n=1 Tax=Cohnella sp. WQ 127256 TaxID=2938790 RepID=UPI0021197AD1|nr:GNAT family N-acetyltransferase [Cohnella sp. WQ 127256]